VVAVSTVYLPAGSFSPPTLLKISAAINDARNLATLAGRLLETIGEAVPAETGALLLLDEEGEVGDEFGSTFAWERKTGEGKEVCVSRTIARQVAREGVALLSNDALEGPDFNEAVSLLAAQTRSLLAVPLTASGAALGVIYLATSDPIAWLDEDHLQLVAAVAASADYHEAVKVAKKQLILRACEQSGGSYVEAAKLLNVHPNYLHRLIRNLNLKPQLKS